MSTHKDTKPQVFYATDKEEKAASDQDLLMAVAGACRLSSPSVKAILEQREKPERDKAKAKHEADEKAAADKIAGKTIPAAPDDAPLGDPVYPGPTDKVDR